MNPPKEQTVLVVEDEIPIALMIRRALEMDGFRVELSHDGAGAIARLREPGIDLMLMDYRLPDILGLALVEQLGRERLKVLPVVVVTSFGDEQLAVQMIRLGVADYIRKDAKLEFIRDLSKIAHQAIDNHALAAENRQLQKNLEEAHRDLERRVERRTAELVAANEALQAEKDFVESVLEVMTDTVLVFDPVSGKAVRWNRAFREISGYDDREIAARKALDDWYDETDLTRIEPERSRLLQDAKVTIELMLNTRGGEKVPFEYKTAPVHGDGGVRYIVSIGRDLRERKQMQARLAQSDQMATIGMLAAGVAHEINNPLTFLFLSVGQLGELVPEMLEMVKVSRRILEQTLGRRRTDELLGDRSSGDELAQEITQSIESALEGSVRVRNIVKDLKQFSRVERRERFERISLRPVLEGAIKMVKNEIRHRARLVVELSSSATVRADASRVSQILLNLLLNSAQAIDEGDASANEIRVSVEDVGNEVMVEIRDTGVGIPQDLLERQIFDPFFTTKPRGTGTGLGLAICQSIVEAHNGRLELESEVGCGTRTRLFLPRCDEPDSLESVGPHPKHVSSDPPSRCSTPVGARRSRVLVVDDEKQIRALIERIVSRDHDVVTASSGSEAQRILAADRDFDAILCDVMMPDGSGIDLHDWLVGHAPLLAERLAFMTGGSFSARAKEFTSRRSIRTISKPFDSEDVEAMVLSLIEKARRS